MGGLCQILHNTGVKFHPKFQMCLNLHPLKTFPQISDFGWHPIDITCITWDAFELFYTINKPPTLLHQSEHSHIYLFFISNKSPMVACHSLLQGINNRRIHQSSLNPLNLLPTTQVVEMFLYHWFSFSFRLIIALLQQGFTIV